VRSLREGIRNSLVIAAIFCVALSITATLFAQTASSSTTLYVDPPSIEDPTILPNDTIIIRIMIDSVVGMKVCRFNLTYSPSVLSVQRVTKLPVQSLYPKMSMEIDDTVGYVAINLTYASALTINTNTGLVEIEFFVKDYGATPLHFDSSTLLDGSGEPIPHETRDGFVRIFIRNIAVKDVSALYTETYVGRIIPINVTVLNEGDIPESFTVSLFYDTTLISTEDVTDLQPKENVTITFNWDTGTVSPSLTPYTIMANATVLPHESNTTDNTLVDGTVKLKILGDVNGDGTVNITDLMTWDAAYLSHPGDPNWNEQADIDYNGVVDKADANIIIEHYKETL
jgi:hypothetical protein